MRWAGRAGTGKRLSTVGSLANGGSWTIVGPSGEIDLQVGDAASAVNDRRIGTRCAYVAGERNLNWEFNRNAGLVFEFPRFVDLVDPTLFSEVN